jgi:hypothetical protein
MNLKVIIPVWGRIEPLKRHVSETSDLFDYLYVVSPEDPYFVEVMDILSGKEVIFYPNDIVSEKINFGIKNCGTEYVMNCGSDDILYDELYWAYADEDYPFCTVTHRDIEGANHTRAIFGTGRRTLTKYIWYPPCNRKMDTLSEKVILRNMRRDWRKLVSIGKAKHSERPKLKLIDVGVPLFKSIYTGDNITKYV